MKEKGLGQNRDGNVAEESKDGSRVVDGYRFTKLDLVKARLREDNDDPAFLYHKYVMYTKASDFMKLSKHSILNPSAKGFIDGLEAQDQIDARGKVEDK